MAEAQYRVGVFGGSGYAGMDLVEILSGHPQVQLVFATSGTYAGQPVQGAPHLAYIPPDQADLTAIDIAFLALPHGVSAKMARQCLDAGVRVIDLSADLRLDTAESYKQWYDHDHPYPDMLAPTPYGLPEIYRDRLGGARAIAAPGCYPTTTILGLLPLLKAGWLKPGAPIIVDAKSGVSGAGREPKPNLQFVEVYSNFSPYNPGRVHRHVGEIEQEIRKLDASAGMLIFTPHLLPVDRGLMSSIYVTLGDGFDAFAAQSLYDETYHAEPLVTVLPKGQQATLKHVVRTNGAAISLTPVTEQFLHITSVTDNLRKGASGQAVQCMNIMLGLPEFTALL
jgi:N-acetyl-gamma-glutamyl-phosphate reductase